MDLTVSRCTHNRLHHVGGRLDGLRRQPVLRDHFTNFLMDSVSPRNAAEALGDLGSQIQARLIRLDQAGASVARNAQVWTALLAARWRIAYATGFIKATLGWHPTEAAIAQGKGPVAA